MAGFKESDEPTKEPEPITENSDYNNTKSAEAAIADSSEPIIMTASPSDNVSTPPTRVTDGARIAQARMKYLGFTFQNKTVKSGST